MDRQTKIALRIMTEYIACVRLTNEMFEDYLKHFEPGYEWDFYDETAIDIDEFQRLQVNMISALKYIGVLPTDGSEGWDGDAEYCDSPEFMRWRNLTRQRL